MTDRICFTTKPWSNMTFWTRMNDILPSMLGRPTKVLNQLLGGMVLQAPNKGDPGDIWVPNSHIKHFNVNKWLPWPARKEMYQIVSLYLNRGLRRDAVDSSGGCQHQDWPLDHFHFPLDLGPTRPFAGTLAKFTSVEVSIHSWISIELPYETPLNFHEIPMNTSS